MGKNVPLADLDIEGEAARHTDGLATRVAKVRKREFMTSEPVQAETAASVRRAPSRPRTRPTGVESTEPNAWRKDKAMLMVPLPEAIHVEISIIAKQRRTTMTAIAREALNVWLESHGYNLQIPV